ncbi:protein PHYTOCHROME KINASE SUBSTRATE 2-like [Raphanus sativus]|uniref:Protein PHYTOCHROME KINASE SUBSTRATE 2-like n=1 Tax=Raphanus sativus TaxID=3726 RepID=A0A9W3CWB6_RAPSA|nr:protein PHYTOCHROME KINASE SUBSTRATE 2-like [Raphanus sativus]
MVTIRSSSSSTPNTSFDFMMSNSSNTLHGPFSSSSTSFSYLTSKEDALTQKNLVSDMNTDTNPEEHQDVVGLSKKASGDIEIGVFGAEKYFNGDMDSDHSSSLVSPSIERIFKQTSKTSSETPSLRSESSWNSQSLLLQNKLENNKKKKSHINSSSCNSYLQEKDVSSNQKVSSNNKKSFLVNLGCKGVCSNWNAVDVAVVNEKRRASGLKKIKTQLSFSGDLTSEMKLHKQQQQQAMLEQRKSLEIFGSPLIEKRIISKNVPWEYSTSAKHEEEVEEEDGSVSDLSSDLFEIESVTGKTKPYLARQESSDAESPDCYAPSEVSIAWSVVTASVADYSVISECATSPVKNRSFQIPRIPITAKSNRENEPQRQKPRSGGGLLLGCKSHKAVRVSGDSYTNVNRTPSYVPRFPLEANPTSIETRRKVSSSSVSRTQSPFLYI